MRHVNFPPLTRFFYYNFSPLVLWVGGSVGWGGAERQPGGREGIGGREGMGGFPPPQPQRKAGRGPGGNGIGGPRRRKIGRIGVRRSGGGQAVKKNMHTDSL